MSDNDQPVAPPADEEELTLDQEDGEYNPHKRQRDGDDEEEARLRKKPRTHVDDIVAEEAEKKFDDLLQLKSEGSGKQYTLKQRDNLADYSTQRAKQLILDMINATTMDEDSMKRGKLALKRVQLCDELKAACTNEMMLSTLVHDSKNNILVIFERWLTPYHDGHLPNLHLRQTILDILLEMKVSDFADDEAGFGGITIDDLKESKIGFRISYLRNHAKEIPSNKVKAKQIIQKWSRLIHNKTDSYSALAIQEKAMMGRLLEEKRSNRGHRRASNPMKDVVPATRARVPKNIGLDFVIRPESKMSNYQSNVDVETQSRTKQRLNKKINQMKRRSKK